MEIIIIIYPIWTQVKYLIIKIFNSCLGLLEKLVPHEFNEYAVRNGIRTDTRTLNQHREIIVKRNIFQKPEN